MWIKELYIKKLKISMPNKWMKTSLPWQKNLFCLENKFVPLKSFLGRLIIETVPLQYKVTYNLWYLRRKMWC